MSWWCKLFRLKPTEPPYGLDRANPVLCGGELEGEMDYLYRLRCPAGTPVLFQRIGSFKRIGIDYLNRPNVALRVSRSTLRFLRHQGDPMETPLDGYLLVCKCGQHREQIFVDMYFRGPELPIAAEGWTLLEGVSPAESMNQTAPCPYCGEELRTPRAKQCRFCMMDWHDPGNVYRSERKAK